MGKVLAKFIPFEQKDFFICKFPAKIAKLERRELVSFEN